MRCRPSLDRVPPLTGRASADGPRSEAPTASVERALRKVLVVQPHADDATCRFVLPARSDSNSTYQCTLTAAHSCRTGSDDRRSFTATLQAPAPTSSGIVAADHP